MMTLEDYKRGIVFYIDQYKKENNEEYLDEAKSLAHRLGDFDRQFYGVQLGYLYEIFNKSLTKGGLK